ncbi:hypothetical protein NE237_031231 [Protea cynaroides]|uniref:Maturase K n=1 Tax=Protea cynaroides TaxID=273540 RepID=A0A9Q0L1V4_9MAGN|nr:hypothetical protein NE237_031231 [Protea cynaroides]
MTTSTPLLFSDFLGHGGRCAKSFEVDQLHRVTHGYDPLYINLAFFHSRIEDSEARFAKTQNRLLVLFLLQSHHRELPGKATAGKNLTELHLRPFFLKLFDSLKFERRYLQILGFCDLSLLGYRNSA